MSRAQNGRLIRLSVSAAVNGLSRNRLATVAATMTMTLMLLVLASVLVIRAGLDAALSYADSKVEVVAYLKVGASEERANSLRNEILKIDGVKEATYITADEALAAFHRLTRTEGILPALESSHAVAQAIKLARELPKDALVLCNLSGRGDKDIFTIAKREGVTL